LIQLPSALLLQPTLGFMPFRLLLLGPRSRSVLVPFGDRNARIARSRAARAGASPVMPYPSKRFPSAAAVPSSPMGVAFSPVPSAALPRDTVASCILGFRWRRPAARPCSAAEVRVQGAVTSGPVPDASLGLILERAGGRCFRGYGANKPHSIYRDRNRSSGRTRVHPVSRPRSDLDAEATGPRVIRRILRGSVPPEGDRATALRRAGRARSIRRRGVAAPRLGMRAAKQPTVPRRPNIAFSFPMSHR
jgi:hypothetical protein